MSCDALCTQETCEALEARIEQLENALELLTATFQQHLSNDIPQAHGYTPQVSTAMTFYGDIKSGIRIEESVTVDNVTDSAFIDIPAYTPTVDVTLYTLANAFGVTVKVDNVSDTDTESFDLETFKGDKGDKGEDGSPGVQGERGEQGLQGEKGETGNDGQDGYTPQKGIDYFDGIDGIDGLPGEKGDKGDSGLPGNNGADGKDGITTIIHEYITDNTELNNLTVKVNKLEEDTEMGLQEVLECCDTVNKKIDTLSTNTSKRYETTKGLLDTINNKCDGITTLASNTDQRCSNIEQASGNIQQQTATNKQSIDNCCQELKDGQRALLQVSNDNTTGIYNKIKDQTYDILNNVRENVAMPLSQHIRNMDKCCKAVQSIVDGLKAIVNQQNQIKDLLDSLTNRIDSQRSLLEDTYNNTKVNRSSLFEIQLKITNLVSYIQQCCNDLSDKIDDIDNNNDNNKINIALNELKACCATLLNVTNDILNKVNDIDSGSTITDLLNTIVEQLGSNLTEIFDTLQELLGRDNTIDIEPIMACCEDLKQGQKGLNQVINTNATYIVSKTKENIDLCCDDLRSRFVGLTTHFDTKIDGLFGDLLNYIDGLYNQLVGLIQANGRDINLFRKEFNKFTTNISRSIQSIGEALEGIRSDITKNQTKLITELAKIFNNVFDTLVTAKKILTCCEDLKNLIKNGNNNDNNGIDDLQDKLDDFIKEVQNKLKDIFKQLKELFDKTNDIDTNKLLQCCEKTYDELLLNDQLNKGRFKALERRFDTVDKEISNIGKDIETCCNLILKDIGKLKRQLKDCCDQIDNRVKDGFETTNDRLIIIDTSTKEILNRLTEFNFDIIRKILFDIANCCDIVEDTTNTILKLLNDGNSDKLSLQILECCNDAINKIDKILSKVNLIDDIDYNVRKVLECCNELNDGEPDWVDRILTGLAGLLAGIAALKGVDYDRICKIVRDCQTIDYDTICSIVRTCVDYRRINDHTDTVTNSIRTLIGDYFANLYVYLERLKFECPDYSKILTDIQNKLVTIINNNNATNKTINDIDITLTGIETSTTKIINTTNDIDVSLKLIDNSVQNIKYNILNQTNILNQVFDLSEDTHRIIGGGGGCKGIKDYLEEVEITYEELSCDDDIEQSGIEEKKVTGLKETLQVIVNQIDTLSTLICDIEKEKEDTPTDCVVLLPDPSAVWNTSGLYIFFMWEFEQPQTEKQRKANYVTQLADPIDILTDLNQDPVNIWNTYFAPLYHILGKQWGQVYARNRARRYPIYKGWFFSVEEGRRFFDSIEGLTKLQYDTANNPSFPVNDNPQVRIINEGMKLVLRKVCIGDKSANSSEVETLISYQPPII